LGCGNVGAALVALLADPEAHATLMKRAGVDLELVAIGVSDSAKTRSQAPWFPSHLLTTDLAGIVARDDVDLVVEVLGGLEPAGSLIGDALTSGKAVVSANKALLAARGRELELIAASKGVDLAYEAAVAGAIPVIRTLRESLAGESISRVMGIVNGTTNFILSKMISEGLAYEQVLSEAQRLGYAERDPSADVEGFDAAAKAAILAGLAFDTTVDLETVHCEGITKLRSIDLAYAAKMGYCVKLLAIAERVNAGVSVRVHPAMVPMEHPLASVDGAMNAVFIEGSAAGPIMLYGQGAGGMPTASAVLGDLIDVARNLVAGTFREPPRRHASLAVTATSDLISEFYLSIDVKDEPGVLAKVADVFGSHGVSIRSMEQAGLGDEARLVFVTHTALERAVAATIDDLQRLREVDAIGGIIRVIGHDEGDH
jgi:homoserine dehydrogenase